MPPASLPSWERTRPVVCRAAVTTQLFQRLKTVSLLEDHCRQRQLPHPNVFIFDCAVGSTVIVISALGGCCPPLSQCPPVRMSAQWPSVPSHGVVVSFVRQCIPLHVMPAQRQLPRASSSSLPRVFSNAEP